MTLKTARLVLIVAGFAGVADAQVLPSEPLAFGGGRLTIGGDISASYGSPDPGFFDYTDYEHSALRMLRINVSAVVKANDHFAILGDVQTENFDSVRPYALYLRIRPWQSRAFDIQIGRVPPTFGAFARRTYVSDNPLIGYPLGYQYLTSLRPDALPANADELLLKRSLGWLNRYSVGSPVLDHGVPLVNGFRWDTGVQVHAASQTLSGTVAVTAGSLSNPLFNDDNGGRQVAARVESRPVIGLVAGGSFARGAFLRDDAARAATAMVQPANYMQTAWGADIEYSRDHFLVRSEAIWTTWDMPFCAACDPVRQQPAVGSSIGSTSISVEGKYTITPGLYAAARAGHVGFSEVHGTVATLPWDAPVSRLEVGGGYSIQRNLIAKLAVQINRRDGGRLASRGNYLAGQIVFWF